MSKTAVSMILTGFLFLSVMTGCTRSGSVYDTGLMERINQTYLRYIPESPAEIAEKSDLILVARTNQDVSERESYQEPENYYARFRTTIRILEVLQQNSPEPVSVGDEIQILETCGVKPFSHEGNVIQAMDRPGTASFPIQKGRPQLLFLYWSPVRGCFGIVYEGQYDLTEVEPTPYETAALTDRKAVLNGWLDAAEYGRIRSFKAAAIQLPMVAPVVEKYLK